MAQSDAAHPAENNSLDDIFGSSPARSTEDTEPSDLPSLRRQHVTAGYRDGISTSKTEHVQRGFDAGYSIGAQLGMRAGTVVGILEGVLRGYAERGSLAGRGKRPGWRSPSGSSGAQSQPAGDLPGPEEVENETEARRAMRERILEIYRAAVRELNVQAVFSGFESAAQETKETPEIQLARKGDRIVAAWEAKVEVHEWEEIMEDLEEKDGGHENREQCLVE